MCGITGLIQKRSISGFDKNETLKKLSQAITHRGPDDYAEYNDDRCGLAIRRLAIQDLTLGIYPFVSDDEKLALVLNGEIYNFPELKQILIKEGFKFKTNCDAEAILYGYQKWGNGIFSKLRGMFAVAIWNNESKKLVLVRDRIGIKPIYYVDTPDVFMFSSEAKSFLNVGANIFKPELDYANVELLLGFMFLPKSNETTLKSVKKIPPATILEVTENGLHFEKYWDISKVQEVRGLSFEDAVQKLDDLLVDSVKIHLLSDAPLGVLLSGGVDSSLVAAIMAKKGFGNKISTFTAKFNHKFNESDLAKNTAQYLGTQHTELNIDVSDVNANIEKYIGVFDDLTTFDGGILTTQILCNEVQKTGIKVLLLGEGADEIFGGYSWFGLSQYPFRLSPAIIRNAAYYYSISRNVTFSPLKYTNYWNRVLPNTGDPFRDITRRELELQLPNHLLMKVDKGSMASSIEARVPYLDHILTEYVYSLPQEYKLKGKLFSKNSSNEKYILREVAKKYLPVEVAKRKKKGFLLPMGDVLNQNIDKVKQYVLSDDSVSQKIIAKNRLESLFKPSSNIINMQNEYMLWRLFILEVWYKSFIRNAK